MSLLAESKGFTAPDEDITQTETLTSSYWGSEAPKMHMMVGMSEADDEIRTEMKNSIGFASDDDDCSIGCSSRDAQTTTMAHRTHQTAYCIHPLNSTSTGAAGAATYERAVQSSYSAYSVANTWSSSSNDGYNYFLMALGGDDVENISIDHITTKTGSTGDVSYTGPGFQPDFLICLGVAGHTTSLPYTQTHKVCQFGMSDGSTHAAAYNASLNGKGTTSVTYSVQSSNFIHLLDGNANDSVRATVKSLDSSGYTLNYTTVHGSVGFHVTIIAVKGPQAKLITTSQPTSNTTNDLDAGFVPRAGICLGSMKTSSQTGSDHNRFTLGAWTDTGGTNHMDCMGWMDEDGQATSDVDRFKSPSYAIKNYDHTQSVVGQATVAVQDNGIRETWTSTNGTQYVHSWLLLGDAAAGAATTNDAFLLFLDSV